jgi:hypothetical protein
MLGAFSKTTTITINNNYTYTGIVIPENSVRDTFQLLYGASTKVKTSF